MTNVTLRQLRALIAIKTHGKIISAAKAVGLTAPAVTLQLRQLEEDAGITLFDRTAHGMRPTAAGLAFIDAAEAIVERLQLLDEELDAIRGVKKGTLTIGMVSTAEYFAPQLIAAFMAQFPNIDVKLLVGKRPETIARLKNYDIDIMLTARPPRDVSVRATAFAEYRLVIVSAPEHPLAGKRAISRDDLIAEHFIVREPGSGPRTSFERFLGGSLDSLGSHSMEMASNDAIKHAVIADLGIAFVATHTVAAEVEAKRLVILDVEGLPIQSQWFAVTRSDRSITPIMALFQDFLTERGAHYLQSHDALYGQD